VPDEAPAERDEEGQENGERRQKHERWTREQEARGAVTDTNVGTDRSGTK